MAPQGLVKLRVTSGSSANERSFHQLIKKGDIDTFFCNLRLAIMCHNVSRVIIGPNMQMLKLLEQHRGALTNNKGHLLPLGAAVKSDRGLGLTDTLTHLITGQNVCVLDLVAGRDTSRLCQLVQDASGLNFVLVATLLDFGVMRIPEGAILTSQVRYRMGDNVITNFGH